MTTALRLDCDLTLTRIELPDDAQDARGAIRGIVGDSVNAGLYHRDAILHVADSANQQQPLNLVAWTLASAWRGLPLYALHGTIVVTGRTSAGDATGLDDRLVRQAEAVTAMVGETVNRWRTQPPASDDAAGQELLAYAARELAAT